VLGAVLGLPPTLRPVRELVTVLLLRDLCFSADSISADSILKWA